MNQKKCPKCGENNPPEAVMCWACYTPLSGGAVAPATAGPAGPAGPRGAGPAGVAGDAATGGASIPSWVYGVIGAVVVVALLVGAKVLLGGGEETTDDGTMAGTPADYAGSSSGAYTSSSGSSAPKVAPIAPSSSSGGTSSAPPQVEIPFNFVALPNRRYSVGVVGIVPKQNVGNPQQAAGIARYCYSLITSQQRFNALQVYVFSSVEAGDRFKQFQAGRQNVPLGPDDFGSLGDLWTSTPAICVFNRGGSMRVVYPQSDPDNFWRQLT